MQVQTKNDGYLVLVSFGTVFSMGLQDLQLVVDVNPLRIDNIVIRNPENSDATSHIGATLIVKILDHQQPVRLTETEVVRVKKRHRGWFSR